MQRAFAYIALLFVGLATAQASMEIKIVQPPVRMKACMRDADCTIVGTDCNMCCANDAVSTGHVQDYTKFRQSQCVGTSQSVCNCIACMHDGDVPTPVCEAGVCKSACRPKR